MVDSCPWPLDVQRWIQVSKRPYTLQHDRVVPQQYSSFPRHIQFEDHRQQKITTLLSTCLDSLCFWIVCCWGMYVQYLCLFVVCSLLNTFCFLINFGKVFSGHWIVFLCNVISANLLLFNNFLLYSVLVNNNTFLYLLKHSFQKIFWLHSPFNQLLILMNQKNSFFINHYYDWYCFHLLFYYYYY